ncbi:hypothetical protein [Chitinophaga solisilvae]|uniref:hypothetical protein n=1 Tax=Chitinophaga solisilvae TaxID=1233460 RepID=UPI00136EE8A5|nr:hypothetical protein [Chitinophaga solisilvae]
MNTDWNWFFSSFCQSAAALIGIIAAFLISRLIGMNEKVNAIISGFGELVIDRNKIIHGLGQRRFRWYNSTLMRYNEHLVEDIRRGHFSGFSEIDILEKIYSEDDRLFKANDVVLHTFAEMREKYGGGRSAAIEMPPKDTWEQIRKERELIDHLEMEARKLIQLFKKNEQELKVFRDTFRPLSYIIIVLMIAFPLTVIYPLHFMPVQSNRPPVLTLHWSVILRTVMSLKGFLLAIFFVTIEGIFLYFLTLVNKMRREVMTAAGRHSPDYQKIHYYSPYLDT